jgi:hypothetical protein
MIFLKTALINPCVHIHRQLTNLEQVCIWKNITTRPVQHLQSHRPISDNCGRTHDWSHVQQLQSGPAQENPTRFHLPCPPSCTPLGLQ